MVVIVLWKVFVVVSMGMSDWGKHLIGGDLILNVALFQPSVLYRKRRVRKNCSYCWSRALGLFLELFLLTSQNLQTDTEFFSHNNVPKLLPAHTDISYLTQQFIVWLVELWELHKYVVVGSMICCVKQKQRKGQWEGAGLFLWFKELNNLPFSYIKSVHFNTFL